MNNNYSTFGFQTINSKIKTKIVHDIFTNVSDKYDMMNDIMCFGEHRIWKKKIIKEIYPIENKIILDVASGTCDIPIEIRKITQNNTIIACDINSYMLKNGTNKLIDKNINIANIYHICADGEKLPIKNNSVDFYTISFGIRNFNNISNTLKEANRVLKPGGKFICLEFAKINNNILSSLYTKYLNIMLPFFGKIFANNKNAYKYLAESIQTFPNQEEFTNLINDNGFIRAQYKNFTFGVVALYTAFKKLDTNQ